MPARDRTVDLLREQYRPLIPAASWAAIEEFVHSTVERAQPLVPYNRDRLLNALTRHALWCWQEGHPLHDDVVFSREIIDAAIILGFDGLSTSSKSTVRAIVMRVAEAIAPQHQPSPMKALPGAPGQPPYSSTEIASIRSWASGKRTPEVRRSANALVALGFGAGLSSREIVRVRAADVVFDDEGAIVTVTDERRRHVPVLNSWVESLRYAAKKAAPDDYLFRPGNREHHYNLVTNFVSAGDYLGVRPQTQRMRSTWIVHHLTRGTYPVALIEAAGVTSFESLSRFARYVPVPSPSEARAALSHDEPKSTPQRGGQSGSR